VFFERLPQGFRYKFCVTTQNDEDLVEDHSDAVMTL